MLWTARGVVASYIDWLVPGLGDVRGGSDAGLDQSAHLHEVNSQQSTVLTFITVIMLQATTICWQVHHYLP